MLYQKPKKKFTELAKIFDKEFYTKDRDDNKLYQYMWNIYYMLACKKKYFKSFDDYDEFASFAATMIYMRFIKKQKNGERMKSVLNYCKKTLRPLRLTYLGESFKEIIDDKVGVDTTVLERDLKDSICEDYKYGMADEIKSVFNNIPVTAQQIVMQTPYKTDPLTCRRLYISCLLSFLNSITLSEDNKKRLQKKSDDLKDELIEKVFKNEKENCIILWKLPESMKDYVSILVTRLRKRIGKAFTTAHSAFILHDDVLDSIMKSAFDKDLENKEQFDYE